MVQHADSPYEGSGPVLSVYLGLGVAPDGHGGEIPLRWRAMRSALGEQGAEESELRQLDAVVDAARPSGRTLAAFAHDGLLESEELDDCAVSDTAVLGPLPVAVPLLRWRQQWVPYVVVQVDRTGADLAAYLGAGPPVAEQVVAGSDDEIERNAPGGWSGLAQARYQHRAEDSWAHNAAEVARHVARLAADVDARLIITAGDVRAVQELTEHLPAPLRRLQEHVTSGLEQATPGRVKVAGDTVRELVHRAALRARADVVAEVENASGGSHLASGLQACAEALSKGAVRQLVLVDRPADDRWGWSWPDPLRVAADAVPPAETAEAQRAPLREVMVRAAFAQSADVTVVGPDEADLPDDVAALVRF
jgi:hypothetical protein